MFLLIKIVNLCFFLYSKPIDIFFLTNHLLQIHHTHVLIENKTQIKFYNFAQLLSNYLMIQISISWEYLENN